MKKIFFLIPFLLVVSCSDSSFDPTLLSDGFKGITHTGPESPQPLGGMYDPSDWCTGKSNGFNKEKTDIVVPNSFAFYPCYPNPISINGKTTLQFSLPQDSFVNLYIIDKYNHILYTLLYTNISAGVHSVMFDSQGYQKGIYRFIIETEQNTCKGDLWIK
ncbi:MAG: hypothetical protein IPM56_07350 [Ignavibacteriales bacterium]|nr:MAG: hypothetical protein IPM56_07350 [Ignavibacteriales bacterium]